jgi:Uma2 family endonuclease
MFNHVFNRTFGDRSIVHIQNPVRLGRHREPEPDVVLLKPRDDFYRSKMPTTEDVLLLVEIADSWLEYDRDTKARLYAEASIVEYWPVNLVDRLILVYRDASPAGYGSVQIVRPGDSIRPIAFPDVAIAVSDVLGE